MTLSVMNKNIARPSTNVLGKDILVWDSEGVRVYALYPISPYTSPMPSPLQSPRKRRKSLDVTMVKMNQKVFKIEVFYLE